MRLSSLSSTRRIRCALAGMRRDSGARAGFGIRVGRIGPGSASRPTPWRRTSVGRARVGGSPMPCGVLPEAFLLEIADGGADRARLRFPIRGRIAAARRAPGQEAGMVTDIPVGQWADSLQDFTKRNAGRQVLLEVDDAD